MDHSIIDSKACFATPHDHQACNKRIMAIHDTLYVLGGKWKISIITSLGFGKKRYSELLREVKGISGKVLSRELKEMETNLLIKRTVLDTQPIAVEYELSEYCENLLPVIFKLAEWGTEHRKKIVSIP